MAHFADTNVAARRILPADPNHVIVCDAIDLLQKRGEPVLITAQVLVEFHALATWPIAANGLGMTSVQARIEARKLEAIFPILPESPAIYPAWRRLIDNYGGLGRQVFDTRLVAVMLAHGITHVLTLNPTDFKRFPMITVVEPKDVS
jgi:predicted nucleic acid-binding protein